MPETPPGGGSGGGGGSSAFPFTPHAQWGDPAKQGLGRLPFLAPTAVDVVGSFMLPGAFCKPVRTPLYWCCVCCVHIYTLWVRVRSCDEASFFFS